MFENFPHMIVTENANFGQLFKISQNGTFSVGKGVF